MANNLRLKINKSFLTEEGVSIPNGMVVVMEHHFKEIKEGKYQLLVSLTYFLNEVTYKEGKREINQLVFNLLPTNYVDVDIDQAKFDSLVGSSNIFKKISDDVIAYLESHLGAGKGTVVSLSNVTSNGS